MAALLRSPLRLRACVFHLRVGRPFVSNAASPAALLSPQASTPCTARAGHPRHLLYQTRHFTVATQEKRDIQEQPVTSVEIKQAQTFDWALTKLDASIKRTGRITENLLLKIFNEMYKKGHPSSNQALLLLRSCGLLLPEVLPAKRTEIVHTMWTKMKEQGVIYDVSHYNALLKVYLQNEHEFSPTEFLTKMEEANIQPNRVTYQRLIAAFCSKGDIVGASNILSFMKNKDLPVMESVFSALVTGHAKAGDMENAENILSVMKDTGIEPGPDTYVALLNAYAEKGDIKKIEETLENIEKTDCYLMDRDLMDIIFTLAKAGYPQYVQNILKKMRCDRNYTPDAMNLCLRLITQSLEDVAFQVLKSFPSSPLDSQDGKSIENGSFFLHHCVNINVPVAKLKHFCDEMKEANFHSAPLAFVLRCALQSKKAAVAFDFMKMMKEEDIPVRPHYFWPLLAWHQKEKNLQGTVEVLNAMHEINVVPDLGTYKNYVLPQFDYSSSVRQHLQEMGCHIEVKEFSTAQIIYEASEGRLNNVLTLMSSPNMSSVDHLQIRMSLISGFRKSVDADLWSKITELLYMDGRYYQTPPGPSEAVGYFLYSLIDNMSDSEVQAKEEQLRQYFHQLNEMKIKIPPKSFRSIQKRLDSCHVPELIKAIMLLIRRERNDMNERGENISVSNMQELDRLKAENRPVGNVLTRIIRDLCLQENLKKALEVKAEYGPDLDVGNYASLIHLCCRQDNAEEAMNLKEELSQKYPSEVLSIQKYLALVEVLGKCGRLDDAINILKEMKEKDVHVQEKNETSLFHTLNNISLKGDVETVKRIHETITSLGISKSTRQLCSCLVTVHLSRNDIPAALEAVLDCCKNYDYLPRFHDVLCKLIENGHTELLQKAVDVVTQEKGELMMLYDLFFAFLSTGKYKEAKKIVETQGFRPRPSRFQWFALKCITNNEIHVLENMVELTENLFECDRDEMYYYLLRACKENNDWQKAEAAWVKMQEENIIPRERTLRLLANILKSNNQEVPFDISQTESDESFQMLPSTLTLNPGNLPEKISRLSSMGKVEEAFDVFLEAKKKNIVFEGRVYLTLIEALLQKGCLEEAMEVKEIAETHIKGFVLNDAANSRLIITQVRRDYLKDAMLIFKKMVENNMVPFTLSVAEIVNALGRKGDVEGIQAVKKEMEKLSVFPKKLSVAFINNTALAYINRNSIDEAIEYLEPVLIGEETHPKTRSISFLFKSLIDSKSETALERLSVMAERLANQFGIYRPVTNLFLQYINGERVEDAKHLLERCSIIGEQKTILNHYLRWAAMKQGQSYKIKTLLDLVSDLDKNVAYFYLLKSYVQDKDLTSAQALYKKLTEEKMQPNEMFLKTYAVFLRKMGEPVPFVEPSNKLTLKEPEYSSDED